MDAVSKNMEKEYTDIGNPESADFSRGGENKILMNDMLKNFFE